tara:strand:- start:57 stop:356 length:300 start_codon:yes stop_codon:yes gene_type:complete
MGLLLPTAVNANNVEWKRVPKYRIEAITGGSLSTICMANSNNYISEEDTASILKSIFAMHLETYKGSKEEATKSFTEVYSLILEYFPECNPRVFKLKLD